MRNQHLRLGLLFVCLLFAIGAHAQQDRQGKNAALESKAIAYLSEHRAKLGLAQDDVADVYVSSAHTNQKTGISYVYLAQRVQGIDVHQAVANIIILANGTIQVSGNTFAKGVQSASLQRQAAPMSASKALPMAAQYVGIDLGGEPVAISNERNASQRHVFAPGNVAAENMEAKLSYIRNEKGKLQLCWLIDIYTKDHQHRWNVFVDATTGALVSKEDLVIHDEFHAPEQLQQKNEQPKETARKGMRTAADGASYFVLPYYYESPNHGSLSLITNPADATASPYGWHDTNGAAGAEFTITRGNNAHAYSDAANTNASLGNEPDGGPTLTFNIPPDFNQNPSTYTDAAVVNVFYMSNVLHDVLYQYGFDEAAGNFQENNYGNGGLGSDFVQAQAQDGLGTNNANFFTPPDGGAPRMQMYIWQSLLGTLTVNSPASIAGNYMGSSSSTFGPQAFDITGDLILTTPANGCSAIAEDLTGKIAVIDRGICTFTAKVLAAQNAGAIGVVIVDNAPGSATPMGGTDPLITIPSIRITLADGNLLKAAMGSGTVNVKMLRLNANEIDRDSDFDNGIIAHEYGHGLSTRLTGGAGNSACLLNEEQMGEGWSDYLTLIFAMDASDVAADSRGIGTYVNFESTTGIGIRPTQYSTSLAVNDYTYADIASPSLTVPHGVGFVWATMLWDMTWKFIDRYGYSADLYAGTGGNNKALQLVIEAMKLQPCSPGFVDGRDAILLADRNLNGGANQDIIWEAFANRGLGFSATQGLSTSRNDGTEAFDLPTPTISYAQKTNFVKISGQSLEDMSAGTTSLIGTAQNDVASTPTNIGFDFYWDGELYQDFATCSNGFMRLGDAINSTTAGNIGGFTSSLNTPFLLAPYYDDLVTGTTGYVRYKLLDTGPNAAPNRKLVIEWLTAEYATNPELLTPNKLFQVWLEEGTNKISYVYNEIPASSDGFSVGIATKHNRYVSVATATHTVTENTGHTGLEMSIISAGLKYTFQQDALDFTTDAGSPSASVAINLTGADLEANLEVNAPTNFEISSDNVTFSSALSLVPTANYVEQAIYIRVSATANAGTFADDVPLASTNAASVLVPVTGTVTAGAYIWNGTSWSLPGTPTAANNAIIAGPYNVAANGPLSVANLTVNPSMAFSMGSGTVAVAGNFRNEGPAFAQTGGSFTFNGTVGQTIGGNNTFSNLTIDNAAGVTLNDATNVTGKLILTSGSLASNGQLTLVSNNAGTGYIVGDLSNLIGEATVQRYVKDQSAFGATQGIGYRYFSSPITSPTVASFQGFTPDFTKAIDYNTGTPVGASNFPNFFFYVEYFIADNADPFTWAWYASEAAEELIFDGEGFIANINTGVTPFMKGELNNGNVTASIFNGGFTNSGWNLLGNPYASPLDLAAFFADTDNAGLEKSAYIRLATSQYSGTWASYINGVVSPSGAIDGNRLAPMQGFFAKKIDPGDDVVIFKESHRAEGTFNAFRSKAEIQGLIRLGVKANGKKDEFVAYFQEGATIAFDPDFDAHKVQYNPTGFPTIWQQTDKGEMLHISGINEVLENQVIPLNLWAEYAGVHSFSATELKGLEGMEVWLEDKEAKVLIDLRKQESYEVALAKGKHEGRFVLYALNRVTGVDDPEMAGISLYGYSNNIRVSLPEGMAKGSIAVFDLSGRLMLSQTIGNQATLRTNLSKGIYVVRVSTESGVFAKKVYLE